MYFWMCDMKFQSGLLTGRSVSLCYTMTLPGIATIDIAERRAGSTAFSLFLFLCYIACCE